MQYEVIHYREYGRDIYQEWLDELKDFRGRATILNAVNKVMDGNFGVHKHCRDGVWELVLDMGPGYRVYYSFIGRFVVLLLCAGQKRHQQRDIDKAVEYFKKYKEEHK